jgi:hypothetical protein
MASSSSCPHLDRARRHRPEGRDKPAARHLRNRPPEQLHHFAQTHVPADQDPEVRLVGYRYTDNAGKLSKRPRPGCRPQRRSSGASCRSRKSRRRRPRSTCRTLGEAKAAARCGAVAAQLEGVPRDVRTDNPGVIYMGMPQSRNFGHRAYDGIPGWNAIAIPPVAAQEAGHLLGRWKRVLQRGRNRRRRGLPVPWRHDRRPSGHDDLYYGFEVGDPSLSPPIAQVSSRIRLRTR